MKKTLSFLLLLALLSGWMTAFPCDYGTFGDVTPYKFGTFGGSDSFTLHQDGTLWADFYPYFERPCSRNLVFMSGPGQGIARVSFYRHDLSLIVTRTVSIPAWTDYVPVASAFPFSYVTITNDNPETFNIRWMYCTLDY